MLLTQRKRLRTTPAAKRAGALPPAPAKEVPTNIHLFRWGFTVALGLWMFGFGVWVGRTTQPSLFEPVSIEYDLIRLRNLEAQRSQEEVQSGVEMLSQNQFDFFEQLKNEKGGNKAKSAPAGLEAAPKSETPGKIKVVSAVPREKTLGAVVQTAEAPAAKEAAPVRTTVSENGQFGIQVASFASLADADRTVERLRSGGFAGAHRTDEDVEGLGMRYRVKIGFYINNDQANLDLRRLRSQENLVDAYIFKRK